MRHYYKRWGYYVILYEDYNTVIKILYIKANTGTHLQLHINKSEEWHMLEGIAEIIVGSDQRLIAQNDSAFVNWEVKHKITAKTDCAILEIQRGKHPQESDIVYLE